MADLEHVAGIDRIAGADHVGDEFAADRSIPEADDAPALETAAVATESRSPTVLDRLDRLAAARWRTTAAAAALIALSAAVPLWFTPFLAGLVLGAVLRRGRARVAAGLVALAAAAGWALPLVVRAVAGEPVLGIARVAAGLAGLPAIGALTVLATLLIAVLQGLAGVWFARAVSGLRHG